MERRATRADVAHEAGVSKTTVTYVLGDRPDIAIPESTRARVRAAAALLGYRPHPAAQALSSGRTNTVTVAFPVHIAGFYAQVLQAFERHTNAHGYHMMAGTIGHHSVANVRPDLWSLLGNLTDGVILVDMPGLYRAAIEQVLPCGKPVLSMGVFTVPSIDCVEVHLEQAAQEALGHLIDGGARRIAFFGPGDAEEGGVTTFAPVGTLDPRIAAYHCVMQRAGRPAEIIHGNATRRGENMAALRASIAAHGCPDALFCFNDTMAISAHRALHEMGYRVPQDVRLVGCDGTEEAEYLRPALSTIVQPVDRMCELAWDLMALRLADPTLPRQYAGVDAALVIRDSSRC